MEKLRRQPSRVGLFCRDAASPWVLGYCAVMLRQASFFALVEYRKSILPQQKIRLPCL